MIEMATYNFELNCRPNKKGKYAVLLRITENQKHRRIKTNVELTKKTSWNAKSQEVRKSDPEHKVMNESLRKFKLEAQKAEAILEENGKGVTSKGVVSTLKAGKRVFSFIDFAEDYAQRTLESGEYRTFTKYKTFLNKLKFFINGVPSEEIPTIPKSGAKLDAYLKDLNNDLLFTEITLSFLNRFKAYLTKIPNGRNPEISLHMNTVSKQFDNFKSLYHKGLIELREDGLSIKDNPFDNFECGTMKTHKEKLEWEELDALNALNLEEGSLLWHTRNCFMMSFYCAGMRAGDLIQLRGTNIKYEDGNWRICYRMDKTSTEKSIKLFPEALEIIKKYVNLKNRTTDYIFPLLDNDAPYGKAFDWHLKAQLPYEVKKLLLQHVNAKNSLLNKYLGKLAVMAHIEKKVSMHIARHSFANIARQKNANPVDIKSALGQSKLETTMGYLKEFDKRSQDTTMEQVFERGAKTKQDALLTQLKSLSIEELTALLSEINQ